MAGNPAFHMIPASVTAPISVTGAVTTIEIDTVNATYGKAQYTNIYFHFGLIGAAGLITALKVQESDTSGSGHADITGASFSTLPADGDDGTVWAITITNSAARKRYYDVAATVGANASLVSILAFNCFPNIQPTTAAGLGLAGLVSV